MKIKKLYNTNDLITKVNESKFNVNHLLKNKGYQNKPLSFDEAYLLGAFTMAPYVSELQDIFDLPKEIIKIQSVVALSTFHNRFIYQNEQSAEQIAGICAAIFDYDIGTSQEGYLNPDVDIVLDNCGMGGDLYRTPNLSTLSALIAAADGVNFLKHGSPGNTDSVGSSDFLSYCGVNLFPSKELVEKSLENLHFGYTDALDEKYKRIHTQTHHFAKLAHMNDIIGPITNPVNPILMKKRIVGINHLIPPERIAQAYRILNQKSITNLQHGLFVRGFADTTRNGGIDEVSIMPGGTYVAELKNGEIKSYSLYSHDFGLSDISVESLHPGVNKAKTSKEILEGIIVDERKDAVLANAGLIFHLTQGLNLKDSTEKARSILESKIPFYLLQEYVGFTNGKK